MNEDLLELYGLLVPLAEERLVVPRTIVAEVLTWQTPQPVPDVPPWYLGDIKWNARAVPVVSFEALCGRSFPAPGTRTRIVIFVAISNQLGAGYFGLGTQGFPQLVRMNPDVVKADPDGKYSERGPVLCQVRLLNESPLIPDFECIEQMISAHARAA
jgi:chemosensory pili system protein ChpC